MRRRSLHPLAAVAPLAVALAACSGSGGGAVGAGGAGEPRDTLVIATQADPKDFLSVVQQSASDAQLVDNLEYPLMHDAFACKLEFEPAYATSWAFSEDGRTIHMELQPGLTWQDGTPFGPEDIAFSYELASDPKVASPRAEMAARLKPGGRPRIVGPHSIDWEFTAAYDRTTMLAQTALMPVPKHLLDSPTVDRSSLRGSPLDVQAPLSNGPWKVTARDKNARIVLEPNENFTGPIDERPRLRQVVLKVLPDYAARLQALQSGAVDLMESVLVSDADALAKDHPEIALHRRGWRSMDYVAWNSIDPDDYRARAASLPAGERPKQVKANRLFGDREVRRALAMAIDTDTLIKDLLTSGTTGEVYGRPAIGTITPALCGVHNDAIKRIPFGAEAARARLGELGWKDTNNDGWLDKDGENFRFTLITNSGNSRGARAAAIIQSELAGVGVDMQIEQIEANTFFERLRRRDFEAALSGWSAALVTDPSPIWGAESEFNFTSYQNPRVAELLAKGLAEPDPDKAVPIWQELQAVIYEDQPYAFLYWTDEIVAVSSRFQDTTIDVLGAWRRLNRWWVPADKVKYAQ